MEAVRSTVEGWAEALGQLPNWAKAGLGVAVVAVGVPLARSLQSKRKSPWKEDWAEGVVYLYQFPRTEAVVNLSPFCLKLETWLRMADVKYENVKMPLWLRSKEGTVPFVELNGKEHPDSSFAIRDLLKLCGKEETEAWLSAEQRGAGRALEAMTEQSALPSYALSRYGDHASEIFSEKVLGARLAAEVPWLLRALSPGWLLRRAVLKRLEAAGIGRHSREEVFGIGKADLDALSAYLGQKDFFMGDRATRVDATVFGLMAQLLYVPLECPQAEHARAHCGNLVEHTERVRRRFWPDWDHVCATGDLDTDWKDAAKYKAAPGAKGAKK